MHTQCISDVTRKIYSATEASLNLRDFSHDESENFKVIGEICFMTKVVQSFEEVYINCTDEKDIKELQNINLDCIITLRLALNMKASQASPLRAAATDLLNAAISLDNVLTSKLDVMFQEKYSPELHESLKSSYKHIDVTALD